MRSWGSEVRVLSSALPLSLESQTPKLTGGSTLKELYTPAGYPYEVLRAIGRIDLDKLGAYASAICAVHCLLTGIALGLLSVAGLGVLGSVLADAAFLGIAAVVGIAAILHGRTKHHSITPALIFVTGLAFIVIGHFAFRHTHAETGWNVERVLSTLLSVLGGLCLVLFHVVNIRMQHRCGCKHCRTGK